jgi:hypothetical protein
MGRNALSKRRDRDGETSPSKTERRTLATSPNAFIEKLSETPSPHTLTSWFIRALGSYQMLVPAVYLLAYPLPDDGMLKRSTVSFMIHMAQIGAVALLCGIYGSDYGMYKQLEYSIGFFSLCLAHSLVWLPPSMDKSFVERRVWVYHHALIVLLIGAGFANFPGGKPDAPGHTRVDSRTQTKLKQAKGVFGIMAAYSIIIALIGLLAPSYMYRSMSAEIVYDLTSENVKMMHDARMLILLAYGHMCVTATLGKWQNQQRVLTVLGIGQLVWGIGSYYTRDFSTPEVSASWMAQGGSHFAFSALCLGAAWA